MSGAKKIGVYNEWGKLKEIVVGIVPDRIIVPSPSYSVMNYLSPNLIEMLRINQGKDGWEIMPDEVAATKQQIDGLASLYEAHGVKVHRPRPWTEVEEEYLASIQSGGWPLYNSSFSRVLENIGGALYR